MEPGGRPGRGRASARWPSRYLGIDVGRTLPRVVVVQGHRSACGRRALPAASAVPLCRQGKGGSRREVAAKALAAFRPPWSRGPLGQWDETTAPHPATWSHTQAPVTAKASDLRPVAGLHTPRCAVTQNTRTHTCRARTRPWQEAVTPDGTAVLSARQFYRGRYKRDFLKVATGTHRSHCAPGSAHTPCSPHDQHGADGFCAPVPSCSFVAPSSPVTDADPAAAPRPFPVGPRGRTRQARGFSPGAASPM